MSLERDMVCKRSSFVLDDLAIPTLFMGEIDTSGYVPDEEAIQKSIEKNRAIIKSIRDEFKYLLENE